MILGNEIYSLYKRKFDALYKLSSTITYFENIIVRMFLRHWFPFFSSVKKYSIQSSSWFYFSCCSLGWFYCCCCCCVVLRYQKCIFYCIKHKIREDLDKMDLKYILYIKHTINHSLYSKLVLLNSCL